jgi:hypothetical protein
MSWAPLVPSQPLRPLPVLWLAVPWTCALYWAASVIVDAPWAAPGWQGELGAMLVFGLVSGTPLGWLALGLTWVWLALAVPGQRRPGLWFAAALLTAPWLLPPVADARAAARVLSAVPSLTATVVLYSVFAAALRGRAVRHAPSVSGRGDR